MATQYITTATTPTLLAFKQDLLKLVDLMNRGQFPATLLSPGTLTILNNMANDTTNTTNITMN